MSRVARLGQIKTPTPSPGYMAYYPGFQATSDTQLLDRSGKNNHATFGSDLTTTEAWSAVANRFSVPLSASGTENNAANMALAASGSIGFVWDPATESLVLACKLLAAATASNGPIFGTSHGQPRTGWRLEVQATSGTLRFTRMNTSTNTVVNTTTAAVADSTEHGVGFAWDAVAQRAYIYVDGVVDAAFVGGSQVTATDWFPSLNTAFCIGGVGHTSGKAITFASAYRGLHLAKRTGALPSNVADLFRRLNQFPHVLISATELPA